MDINKFGKLIYAVICLVIFISAVNCYGAKEKAEDFFEAGEINSSVENADKAISNYSKAIKINPYRGAEPAASGCVRERHGAWERPLGDQLG